MLNVLFVSFFGAGSSFFGASVPGSGGIGGKLGAFGTINYKEDPTWEKTVFKLTEGRGVDHVIEVGGAGTLGKSLASVSAGGHIALIGVLTGFGPPSESLFPLVGKNTDMSGIYVGSRADFEAMRRALTREGLGPEEVLA